MICRALIASIRGKGRCPCPRCIIPLSRVQNLGKLQDMKQRVTLARIDNDVRRYDINRARELIYKNNYAVNSTHVKNILNEQSLVPTAVSPITNVRLKTEISI